MFFGVFRRWAASVPDLATFPIDKIRNFSIIAHIDHGKSTLADRLLEMSGTIAKSGDNKQVLDKLKVERDRGITVKAQTASMIYQYEGQSYLLNLIDTPGHVDFSYEVSRSLAACQGSLLLVDACQGIQAQTVANFYLAFEQNLSIIPVLNKIDLPTANADKVLKEIEAAFELSPKDCLSISAKTGFHVPQLFPAIIKQIPPPSCNPMEPFTCLLFDTWYDQYKGVVCLVAVKNGKISVGEKINSAHSNKTYEVLDTGIMYPDPISTGSLFSGQVGYLILGMKSVKEAFVGDTFYLSSARKDTISIFPGFQKMKSMVFSGLYPVDSGDFQKLQEALEKLALNDTSVTLCKESSMALGLGFRLGFLGTLHMDVFRQRLEEEYDAQVINTAPTVPYKVRYHKTSKEPSREEIIENPAMFPDCNQLTKVEAFLEPWVLGTLIFPQEYIGSMLNLCESHRGEQVDYVYLDTTRVMLKYKLPLAEILTDFNDKLKSQTSGYGSFDYEEIGYQESELVRIDYLIHGKPVDALTQIAHRLHAESIARTGVTKLKSVLSRELFEVSIQASIRNKVIARETIKAYRRDVTAKCYGGDVTRKMKLLERQKEGKKRMKLVGQVRLPQEAFLTMMKK